jgi:hypothetical protein
MSPSDRIAFFFDLLDMSPIWYSTPALVTWRLRHGVKPMVTVFIADSVKLGIRSRVDTWLFTLLKNSSLADRGHKFSVYAT